MTATRRRLLIIAVDVPPVATSGSFRLTGFVRHLPEHGWETSVLTTRRPFYGDGDTVVADGCRPDHCEVVRAFGFDTKAMLSWRGRYPGVLAFPDRAASWIADGIRRALVVCRRRRIDAILSSSPAVSAHVIAYAVKRIKRLPWVADLRDPWNLGVPHGPLLQRLDKRLERRMLAAADRITVAAGGMLAALEHRCGRNVTAKVRLVANGYDEHAIPPRVNAADRQAEFGIVHTGTCASPYRDPAPFLRAVRLCLDRGGLPANTSIDLIGSDDAALRQEVGRLELQTQVHCHPRVSHQEALAATARAPVLLVLQTRPDHDCCIPAKVYEYLCTDAAILGVVRARSDTAELLRRFDGVTIVPPADIEALAGALANLYRDWQAGRARGFSREVAAHSRRRNAAELATVLAELGVPGGVSAA